MTTWNLHLVGHDLEESLEGVVSKLLADLAQIGHVLDSAVLTTDKGPADLTPTPAAAEPDSPSTTDSAPPPATPPAQTPSDVTADTPPSL